MSIIDFLKQIAKRNEGVVCFAFLKNCYYYGINTKKENDIKLNNFITNMFDYNSIQCVTSDTFILFPRERYYDPFIKNIENNFYENIFYSPGHCASIDFSRFCLNYIPYNSYFKDLYSLRMYSCAERKVIGKSINFTGSMKIELYCTKKPCLLCLPAVKSVWISDTVCGIKHLSLAGVSYNLYTYKLR